MISSSSIAGASCAFASVTWPNQTTDHMRRTDVRRDPPPLPAGSYRLARSTRVKSACPPAFGWKLPELVDVPLRMSALNHRLESLAATLLPLSQISW